MQRATSYLKVHPLHLLDWRFGPPTLPLQPPTNIHQEEDDDDGGAVDGDIDSEVILAQTPSKHPHDNIQY